MVLGIANAAAAIGYKLLKNFRLDIPQYFYLYLVFLAVLFIHSKLVNGNLSYFRLLISGGLIWMETYNYKDLFSKYFIYLLTGLGILMGTLYFYSLFSPVNLPEQVSLFALSAPLVNHSLIGELWTLVLVIVYYLYLQKKSPLLIPLFVLGLYFLLVSFSRTAIVSLAAGAFYLHFKTDKGGAHKKSVILLVTVLLGLLLYTSIFKTVIFSRPYFTQAINGLKLFPLGTGIGNFSYISEDSNLVHNLILEMVSGMGIFSLMFIVWLALTLSRFIKDKNTEIISSAIFLTIFANFCFNATYVIPAFVWLWFISLGLI